MSKALVNRITLMSALSGALLAVHLVLPFHFGHNGVIQLAVSSSLAQEAGAPLRLRDPL
jgi:hypothetical protein